MTALVVIDNHGLDIFYAGSDTNTSLSLTWKHWKPDGRALGEYNRVMKRLSAAKILLTNGIKGKLLIPKAKTLTTQLLATSVKFAASLGHWIDDQMRQYWAQGYSVDKSWEIMEQQINQVWVTITETHLAGLVGAQDRNDATYTATSVLWGIFNAHKIMEDLIKHSCKESTEIAAIQTC